jgi:hypothetical protein
MLREFWERLRYRIERLFVNETSGQLMLLLFLVGLSTVIGLTAQLAGLFSEDNADVASIPRSIDSGFWDALWWTLQRVLYLSRLETVYGGTTIIVLYSIFLTLVGMVVFATVFSLVTTAITSTMESLRKGDTLVKERGHVLVLGWSNKVFSVLRQLAEIKPGCRIVILSRLDVDSMQEALRLAGIDREPITVILRTGDPSRRAELERVALEQATGVIVLSPVTAEDSVSGDSEVIKIILQLVSYDGWIGEPPVLTAEVAQERNYELAEIASKGQVHLVSSSTVISKVIVQSMRNPGLVDVYRELLDKTGNKINVVSIDECADQELGLVSFGFSDAVPIGVAWDEERDGRVIHKTGLNPEPDYPIADDEKLVLLSRSLPVKFRLPSASFHSAKAQDGEARVRAPEKVLLIGWNGNIFDILTELDAHSVRGTEVTVLSTMSEQRAHRMVQASVARPLNNLYLKFREGDSVLVSAYNDLPLADFQSIALLADEGSGESDIDGRTLRTMLRLDEQLKPLGKRPHIVLELMTRTNQELVGQLGVDDVIISAVAVSAQLAQISQQSELGPIYRELLSAGGVEISLRPADDYVTTEQPCQFADLLYAAQQKQEIALGVRTAAGNGNGGQLWLNPDREKSWEFGADDRVVVLAQQIYR